MSRGLFILMLLVVTACGETVPVASCPDECPDSCVAGECPSNECDRSSDCSPDYRCQLGVCVERLPCDDVVCARGVCEPETGVCVNAKTCDETLGNAQCVNDFYCLDGRCVVADEVCDALACDRGICEPGTQRCVSKEVCEDDFDCALGSICIDGKCGANLCDECTRGVCDRTSGRCVDAEDCTDTTQCLEGSSCIDGRCDNTPCDECVSNQVCRVPSFGTGVECLESADGCFETLGCLDDRVCRDGSCGAARPCVPDFDEPNNTFQTATVLPPDLNWKKPATACPGDEDVFVLDYSSLGPEGFVLVDVGVDEEDEGRANLLVQLLLGDGTVLAESSGWEPEQLMVPTPSEPLFVRVGHDDDRAVGTDYRLSGTWLPGTDEDACGPFRSVLVFPLTSEAFDVDSRVGGELTCGGSDQYGLGSQTFEVTEWSRVEVEVRGDFAAAAIAEGCGTAATEITCAAGVDGSARLEALLGPGTYDLVVSGRFPFVVREIEMTPLVCAPLAEKCLVGGTEQVCRLDGSGYFERTCEMGCDPEGGGCLEAEDESCSSPRALALPTSEVIAWDKFRDDVQLEDTCGSEPIVGGVLTDGPDAVFEVRLPPFERLDVELDPLGSTASLYAVEKCQDAAGTCRAATAPSTQTQLLRIENDDFVANEYLVVVDTVANMTSGSSTVSFDLVPRVCSFGTAFCDGRTAVKCIDGGYEETREVCLFGCNLGFCLPPNNATCLSAAPLLTVPSYQGSVARLRNAYAFSGVCGGDQMMGPDAAFDVTGAVGEVVNISLSADFDASLSVVTDCFAPDTTCVGSSANQDSSALQFIVEPGKQYFAVVDSPSGSVGNFEIAASSGLPDCAGDAPTCVDATTRRVCTELDRFIEYSCDGECSNGYCRAPRGTTCLDPVRVGLGITESFVPLNTSSHKSVGGGTFGACSWPADEGADRFYQVDLMPGDVLDATLFSGPLGASLLVTGGCSDASACLVAEERSSVLGETSIQYVASAAETVFVVVDSTGTGPGSTAQMSIEIDVTRACTGTSATCAADGITVEYCSGNLAGSWVCPGNCVAGACDDTSADSCFQAPVITSDTTLSVASNDSNYSSMANDRFGSCTTPSGRPQRGPDSFFEIELNAGETVTIQEDGVYAELYLFEECGDLNSCIAGATDSVSYRAETDTSVWLAVDSDRPFSTPFDVDLTFENGRVCAPGTWSCDATGSKRCDVSGSKFVNAAACPAACDAELCATVKAGDSCAAPPTVSGGSTRIDLRQFTDEITLTGCGGLTGPEYVQAVDLVAGDVLRATVDDRQVGTTALAIMDSCGASSTALECRVSNSTYGLDFVAPTTGKYYVVLEGSSPGAGFVDLEIEAGPPCTGQPSCMPDGATVEYCDIADVRVQKPCSSGVCSGGACAMGDAQSCVEAMVIGPGSHMVWLEGANTFEFTGPACPVTASMGPDDYLALDLAANETVTVTTNSFIDLFIVEDCTDGSACPATMTAATTTAPRTLTYQAPRSGRYYLIVNSAIGSAQLFAYLDVSISP